MQSPVFKLNAVTLHAQHVIVTEHCLFDLTLIAR